MSTEGPPLHHSWLPVWDVARVTQSISAGAVHRALDPIARAELDGIGDLSAKVTGALQHPKPLDISMPVFNAVLAAQYYELFAVLGLPRTMQVYEPCVGGSNPVIIGAAAHSGEEARYVAMNLNQKLRKVNFGQRRLICGCRSRSLKKTPRQRAQSCRRRAATSRVFITR